MSRDWTRTPPGQGILLLTTGAEQALACKPHSAHCRGVPPHLTFAHFPSFFLSWSPGLASLSAPKSARSGPCPRPGLCRFMLFVRTFEANEESGDALIDTPVPPPQSRECVFILVHIRLRFRGALALTGVVAWCACLCVSVCFAQTCPAPCQVSAETPLPARRLQKRQP